MLRPVFCNSSIRSTVFSNEARTRLIVASGPPEADLPNCQSEAKNTKVDGSCIVFVTLPLNGLKALMLARI